MGWGVTMGYACFFGIAFGLLAGFIFTILFISFDSGWKKILSAIFSIMVSGSGLWNIYDKYRVDTPAVFVSMGCLCLSLIISFIICFMIACRILIDKDNNDTLRARDILLGQKKYIETYYENKAREIDVRLNIPTLEKREQEVAHLEQIYDAKIESFEQDKADFNKLTAGKLKIKLPEKKELIVTKEFLDLFPSYVENLGEFVHAINSETEIFLKGLKERNQNATYEDLVVFLTMISMHIIGHLFHKSAKDVRVHFRYYDDKKKGFNKLISFIASKEYKRDMTFIPCDKANMIMKSFECRRALIKSHNIDYDYVGKNSTTWPEYMTGAFYNITKDEKPCISFGISVKNAAKYRHLFNFLNYCKVDAYIQEVIEQFNEQCSIEAILYGDHTM